MLSLLYRGPLSSCNYGCEYCPFAKQVNTRLELQEDAVKLERFVDWVLERSEPSSVLFTPWGEALIRPSYQQALQRLSNARHVAVAAIQTNLSGDLRWVDACSPSSVGIWATYHQQWCQTDEFVSKVKHLHETGVRVSVGVVGMPSFAEEIESLRRNLPAEVYLWINAAKSSECYSESLIERFEAVDPLFRTNTIYHPSLGRRCRTGQSVLSVDGSGAVRRCHFVDQVIGNIYDPEFSECLQERPCPNETCGCHIGYVHLDHLQLGPVYGDGILERIPSSKLLKPVIS